MNKSNNWQFIDNDGSFSLDNPHHTSYLYFPLVNDTGMMSSITPSLNGDIKIHQNAFLTLPVSLEDLHNTRSNRNFWVVVDGAKPWSVTGISAAQTAQHFSAENIEQVKIEAGFLWHKIIRDNISLGLQAEITNFVPANNDRVELMKVAITNKSMQPIHLTPTAAIPIYGRSADNLRDHRHVTSLLHRIHCCAYGVCVQPTLSFDERGHISNDLIYAVLATGANGDMPIGFFPLVEEFIGEGGTFDWPEAIISQVASRYSAGQSLDGFEAIGGIQFEHTTLLPGETTSYVMMLAILDQGTDPQTLVEKYGRGEAFDTWLAQTKSEWHSSLDSFGLNTADKRFDLWMRWVSLQPTLRRLFGNSFLPAHDYGRGGRGWRDLWQDILALLLTDKEDVGQLLHGYFAGVRFDGSNATIIGSTAGEFKADRNNIPRVWMDHGAWPLLTTRLYIDQTGDLGFLLRPQTYFKDHLIYRSQKIDRDWKPEQGTQLCTKSHQAYYGTIFEHLLIQHLTQFYNVGEHNIILLEGADWNDGMDMAPERGESVAFTALYASNLSQLSDLTQALKGLGIDHVELAVELLQLLDTLSSKLDYDSVEQKRARLKEFYASCRHTISGDKVTLPLEKLAQDLAAKAKWMKEHIRENEWILDQNGFGWFNGYYDNDGKRVEGEHPNGVRMTLTGQVFTLMEEIATNHQTGEMIKAADHYLWDSTLGGYRLNTDFKEVKLNLGRAFGFAYGHKENGAMFSHMAVMFANALYKRGLVHEGYKILNTIYKHCQDFKTSRIYPGIPEYINPKGRGMYTWLTGSASWYLMTLVTDVFGVRGYYGDLVLEPKLVRDQFDTNGSASVTILFAGKRIKVCYRNPNGLDYGEYQFKSISINNEDVSFLILDDGITIPRKFLENTSVKLVEIIVDLDIKE